MEGEEARQEGSWTAAAWNWSRPLYFAGVPFPYSFASMLIGGIDRDAGYVAQRVAARAARNSALTTRVPETAGAERA